MLTCKHCGNPIEIAEVMGIPMPKPCSCEGARKAAAESFEREKAESFREGLRAAMKRAGIPAGFETAEAPSAFTKPLLEDGKSLWLFGDRGVGKTWTSCAVGVEWLRATSKPFGQTGRTFLPCSFTSSSMMLSELRSTFDSFDSEQDVLAKYVGTKLLILDDLGKEKPTPYVLERLFNIVDSRYSNGTPLVITSNYGPRELGERLAQGDATTASAVISRLDSMCSIFNMVGRDLRVSR